VDAEKLLGLLRPLVIVVDGLGTIREAHGGMGGFLGWSADQFGGRSVFEFIAPAEHQSVATYLVGALGDEIPTVDLPAPFRVALLGADAREHFVDVIPTGRPDDPEIWGWVMVLVPTELEATVSRSLDAEISGEPRDVVRGLLTTELAMENAQYSSRWFFVDLADAQQPTVTSQNEADAAEALEREFRRASWVPWAAVAAGGFEIVSVRCLPGPIQVLCEQHSWCRMTVAPVFVGATLAAAYVAFTRVRFAEPVDTVNTNVGARIRGLVDATAMILERWRERDRLLVAASRDPLTGLANRDTLADALATDPHDAMVLYVDVDCFKLVNDVYGHHVGDSVLVEIARRLERACRPSDVIARIGGDEFVILLNNVERSEAMAIGDRVVLSINAPLDLAQGPERVTVSVGLAPMTCGTDSVDAADRAMLHAKREGRGRLVLA
jgi:diguanylate cyclase (GGDEF)-like protein